MGRSVIVPTKWYVIGGVATGIITGRVMRLNGKVYYFARIMDGFFGIEVLDYSYKGFMAIVCPQEADLAFLYAHTLQLVTDDAVFEVDEDVLDELRGWVEDLILDRAKRERAIKRARRTGLCPD
jgi:flavodoxin